MNEKSRTRIVVISLFILLPLVFVAGLLLGSESISFQDIKTDKFSKIILFDIRLPRTLLALLCGSLLAGSGAVFQGFFRSPLADSSMLGVTAGAAFGATIGSGLGVWMPFGAFVGAILCIVLVFFLSCGKKSSHEPIRLLLAGNAVSVFLSALTSVLQIRPQPTAQYGQVVTLWRACFIASTRFMSIACAFTVFRSSPIPLRASPAPREQDIFKKVLRRIASPFVCTSRPKLAVTLLCHSRYNQTF